MKPIEYTREYYSKWLGVDPGMLNEPGVYWAYGAHRNERPPGYPGAIDVYLFMTDSTIIVSYGDRAAGRITELKRAIAPGVGVMAAAGVLGDLYLAKPKHHIKYVFLEAAEYDGMARMLTEKDYAIYLKFFTEANPDCRDTSWAEEYFLSTARKGYCHGVVIDGILVSATDAPDMPFMADSVQEIGINTLAAYQGKGYGRSACLSCIRDMLRSGISPLWSTTADNIASQRLAAGVGFAKYFDNLTISIN